MARPIRSAFTLFINGETYGLNVDRPPVIAYNTTTHLAHKGLERESRISSPEWVDRGHMAHERKGNPMNIYYQAASVLAFQKIVMSRAGGMHCSWISSMIPVPTEWISKGCMDITSLAQFESKFPKSKLQETKLYCKQSLDDDLVCDYCTKKLLSLGDRYLHGPRPENASDCPVWFRRTRRGRSEKEKVSPEDGEVSLDLGFGLHSRGTNLVTFRIEEIRKATMNFSRHNIIGRGGYENVYKGMLPDGSEVAFKRFKNCSASGAATFAHEVKIIASVRPVNLVSIRGYCTTTVPPEAPQRIIVRDLMRDGSLYNHLFESGKTKLSWPIRQKISLGTAYWAWSLARERRGLDVIEENLPEMGSPEVMEQYVHIALTCAHPLLHARPTSDQIVNMLETNMPVPSSLEAYIAASSLEICSIS
ncbi:hypothetical protein D5086_024172 [Populus alba]|uniref:Uncharacterized protein n=1 Tax=Populus alba TaxID=43335 RepID=A0ACC4B585_POPAL